MRIVRERSGSRSVTLYDFEPTTDRLCEDVAVGLNQAARKLPPKYFYDERGAALFLRITELEEYYLTRTEISILRERGAEIAGRIGPGARIVEFGSGSGEKTWLLLERLVSPSAYVPVDISRTQLVDFAIRVATAFPTLDVVPVCADYTTNFPLPRAGDEAAPWVAFFPGSTLGNFEPEECDRFLERVHRMVGPGGGFLLGIDLLKDPDVIVAAYDDAGGVTAEFNLNLLSRINRECGADFDLSRFRHEAVFDADERRIEMRLVSLVDHTVRVPSPTRTGGSHVVRFARGDYIVTEYSYKYDLREFGERVRGAGWSIVEHWLDDEGWFAVVLLGRD